MNFDSFFLVHPQLSEWIKTTSTESEYVSKALCEDISKHCRSTSATIQIDDEL
ncbi:Signal peptide peptidase [Zea mays]|uniref:Signal peptide peptidase n=1 Tax=Zea mays TaxID=4577 RepID=A0A1D6QUN1_MAIZE|nr:Signal peptide peptidase [Zea mays]